MRATTRIRPWVQFALLAGPLLTMIDSGVVNLAIPDIGESLHSSLGSVQWTVSAFLLALAVGLSTVPWLARRFGTVTVYRAGLASFTIVSGLCAAAPTVSWLIISRIAQGLAGAPLVPLALTMLFGGEGAGRKDEVPVAAGIILFVAPALGPSVGGILISTWGWPLIFLVNVPVGAASFVASRTLRGAYPNDPDPTAKLDIRGLVLLALGSALVVYGASEGSLHGWLAFGTLAPLSGGFLLLGAYVHWERTAKHPILDLAVLRHRMSAYALALCVLASVITFGVVFLAPVLMQMGQNHSATAAGVALIPQGLVAGISTAAGNRLPPRIGLRATVMLGMGALVASTLGLLAVGAQTSLALTSLVVAGRGLGVGLAIQPLLLTVIGPFAETSVAADANTTFYVAQRMGGALGIGLVGSLSQARIVTAGPVAAFHVAVLAISIIALVGLVWSLVLPAQPSMAQAT
jgi:EmrB/QacA subfamily drug resistance transporter